MSSHIPELCKATHTRACSPAWRRFGRPIPSAARPRKSTVLATSRPWSLLRHSVSASTPTRPWDAVGVEELEDEAAEMLAHLLLSASSAALSRNDVWVSRFGVDQFAKLINASSSMALLAFIALGLSSIISTYYVFSSVS